MTGHRIEIENKQTVLEGLLGGEWETGSTVGIQKENEKK